MNIPSLDFGLGEDINLLRDAPGSPVKSGLIGAGIAVLVLGGVVAAAFGMGWIG